MIVKFTFNVEVETEKYRYARHLETEITVPAGDYIAASTFCGSAVAAVVSSIGKGVPLNNPELQAFIGNLRAMCEKGVPVTLPSDGAPPKK